MVDLPSFDSEHLYMMNSEYLDKYVMYQSYLIIQIGNLLIR